MVINRIIYFTQFVETPIRRGGDKVEFDSLSRSTLSPKLNMFNAVVLVESEWFLSPECRTSFRLCRQYVPGFRPDEPCQIHSAQHCPADILQHRLLSVQCYAWTEYKFTCVCLSVCVCVNSPTGHTSQRIFTVDSLKDADLRKDVPFGGLDDE